MRAAAATELKQAMAARLEVIAAPLERLYEEEGLEERLEERLEELSGNTEAALASAQDAIGQLTKRQHLEAVGELIGGVDKNVHVLQEEVVELVHH